MTTGGPDPVDYGMFSDAGNAAVDRMVVEARYRTRNLVAEDDLLEWIEASKERIGRAGHREVFDTMVREAIAVELDEAWRAAYGHGRIARLPASGVPGSKWFYHG